MTFDRVGIVFDNGGIPSMRELTSIRQDGSQGNVRYQRLGCESRGAGPVWSTDQGKVDYLQASSRLGLMGLAGWGFYGTSCILPALPRAVPNAWITEREVLISDGGFYLTAVLGAEMTSCQSSFSSRSKSTFIMH